MLYGHTSHQIGLDVDIWFTPMPDHQLSPEEREFNMALNMVAKDRPAVDPKVWTYERTALVRAAARDQVVTRIFVNGGGTTSISTCVSLVRPIVPNASHNRQWVRVTDAAKN